MSCPLRVDPLTYGSNSSWHSLTSRIYQHEDTLNIPFSRPAYVYTNVMLQKKSLSIICNATRLGEL
jgi:hypothetical protein